MFTARRIATRAAAPGSETDVEIFHIIFRNTIQSVVIGVWSLVLLALVVGSIGRTLGLAWRFLHPARALVPIRNNDDVIDAEWVREI